MPVECRDFEKGAGLPTVKLVRPGPDELTRPVRIVGEHLALIGAERLLQDVLRHWSELAVDREANVGIKLLPMDHDGARVGRLYALDRSVGRGAGQTEGRY